MLDEAGWVMGDDGVREKDGEKLALTFVNASWAEDLGPIIQSQINAVGADVTIDLVPGPIQLERAQSGDFHTIYLHMSYADTGGVLDLLYHSRNQGPGGWSWGNYKDPELDALLDEANITVDQEKRCELLVDAQKIIAEQALVLPTFGSFRNFAAAENVKGLSFGPRPNVDLWLHDVYVE
jgi:peptide/nickel transport system substrate-binding protein